MKNQNQQNALNCDGLTRGDTNAFGKIYDEHIDSLIFYGLKICGDKDKVLDGIHDLFIDLFKYKIKFSDINSIEYYLKTSLKHKLHKPRSLELPLQSNTSLAHLQSKNSYTKSHEDTIILGETINEKSIKLKKAFKTLTKNQRKGLNLRYKECLSYEEISDILGISVSSARTTIYRAIKSLRQNPLILFILLKSIFF